MASLNQQKNSLLVRTYLFLWLNFNILSFFASMQIIRELENMAEAIQIYGESAI